MTAKDRISLFFLSCLCIYAFAPQYFSDRIIAWLDAAHYFYPFRDLTAEAVRNGIMPMWNPYIYCGNPLIANMQSAVFYPLSVFFYLLPFEAAVRGITFAAYFIMSFSFYCLARLYKISEEGSFLAAVIYSLTFFMMVKAPELADLHVMVWIPAGLYFMKKHLAGGALHDAVLSGACVALSFLGGHPQVFLYAFILYCVMFAYEALQGGRGLKKSIASFFIIMAVPLFAVGFQAFVTLKFILLSKRADAGLSPFEIKNSYLNAWHILTMFFGFVAFYADVASKHLRWSGQIDIGPAAMLLVFIGVLFAKERRLKIFLLVFAAFSLLLVFLGHMPFFDFILENFALFRTMRFPSKVAVMLLFCMALLAGMGFDAVFKGGSEKGRKAGTVSAVILLTVFVVFCVLLLGRDSIVKLYKDIFDPEMTFVRIYEAVETYNSFIFKFGTFLAVLAAAVLLIYAGGVKGIKPAAAGFILLLLIALTESHYSNKFFNYYEYYKLLKAPTTSMEAVKGARDFPRVLAPNVLNELKMQKRATTMRERMLNARDVMIPNALITVRIMNADGFDSLMLASRHRLKMLFAADDRPWEHRAFSLLSADYIASVVPLAGASLREFYTGAGYIYENANSVAKAFFVPSGDRIVYTDDEAGITAVLNKKDFDPYFDLVIEKNASGAVPLVRPASRGFAAVYELVDLNTIRASVKTESPGFLVVADNHYPGWKARVNGDEADVYLAYGTYKAVAVKAGDNSIVFKYEEEYLGGLLAAASMFLMLLSAAAVYYGRRICRT